MMPRKIASTSFQKRTATGAGKFERASNSIIPVMVTAIDNMRVKTRIECLLACCRIGRSLQKKSSPRGELGWLKILDRQSQGRLLTLDLATEKAQGYMDMPSKISRGTQGEGSHGNFT